jgi:glutamate racemase
MIAKRQCGGRFVGGVKGSGMAVGIFDSGLGGLTVLDAVTKRLPDVPFVYFGDNAHAPYGVRTADDIFNLTCAAVERLWAEGCDLVILACNTASAAALKRMQETWVPADKRVLGVFVPLIEALTERQWGDNSPPREVAVKHVALFATPATVASRAFQRELAYRAIGVDVEAQPCGGVVDAIEQGDEILAEALVRSHVEALKRRMPHPEAAILGCTHYPLMDKVFQDALGAGVKVYSQANLVAESLADYLTRRPEFRGTGTQSKALTTGDPAYVSNKATQFLRRRITFEAA